MGQFSQDLAYFVRRAATEQGGVISGVNPSKYNPSDPLQLWVIQVVIIVALTQLLSLVLARVRQPRVIAEVIGGIILGPTVMGRIPGFQAAIFPNAGMPSLTLTSTIGLVVFLFLVGLEIDVRVVKRNMRASTIISLAGLLVPLGLGAALGVAIYHEFINPDVNFGYFLLFTAVAVGITAFPVLCRILTELKLLDTTVGVVVLSAGVGNDVVGWILLALAVALVNASSGLTALWVLLACVGFVLFLLLPGRWAFVWLARRTGSLEQGSPTPFMMTVTLLVVFISAFFTDIIGVHAIFGGFLAGLIIPHENGFAISIVEKLEDLVSILFLPIYFTLSGLRTNLGSLNTGTAWGYTILICVVAFSSKFLSCAITALLTGYNWREAGAVGSLMSCKGLVELIVLNIGLQAGILDTRTFSMFVVHALILTVLTTPMTLAFYPERVRARDGHPPVTHGTTGDEDGRTTKTHSLFDDIVRTKFAIVLDKMEQLPAAMTFAQLLQGVAVRSPSSTSEKHDSKTKYASETSSSILGNIDATIDAIRLMELTTRTSALLRSQEAEVLIYNDPVLSVFKTFGMLNRITVSASLSVVNYDEFSNAVTHHAMQHNSEMIILPWSRGITSVLDEVAHGKTQNTTHNPFDGIFHKTTTQDQTSSVIYSEFIRNVFLNSKRDVALFVDRGLKAPYASETKQHLFLPFFGGPDDREALSFLVQLCINPSVCASVVRISVVQDFSPMSSTDPEKRVSDANLTTHNTVAAADTVYPAQSTQTRLASDTADNVAWDRYTNSSTVHSGAISYALSRITFRTESSSTPLRTVRELVDATAKTPSGRPLIVVLGRSRRMAVESHQTELKQIVAETGSAIGSSVPRVLGDVGASLVAVSANASLLIVQAALHASR